LSEEVTDVSVSVPAKTQIYRALDGLNSEQLGQLWEYIQQLTQQQPVAPLYRIHEQALGTGIKDLANQHDHYLYGSDKRDA
jgi:hypothetical protein